MYQPKLFIGIGKDNHFFTLRESYEHWFKGAGGKPCVEIRSLHHFNLSQDPNEAIAKATEAAGRMGLPLHTTAAEITEQLAEIKRRTAEQVAEAAAREERWKAEREEREAANLKRWHEQIAEGFFPQCFRNVAAAKVVDRWGWSTDEDGIIYLGAIADAEIGYLNWLMDKGEAGEFEAGSLIALVAAYALEHCTTQRLPRPDKDKHTGEIGKRQTFKVTVIRAFEFNGFYGMTHFVTMVAEDGCCLMSKGAFKAEVGDKLVIKATVKAHDEYKGQAQTVVQRVKVEA